MFFSDLAGEVLFGPFVFRCGEQGLRAAGFDQLAEVHKQRVVRDPRRLRHIVRYDNDRELFFQFEHQLFDAVRRDRVERRGRFVHQQHFGFQRDRAGDAQPLLLSAGEESSFAEQRIAHFAPESDARKARFDDLVLLRFRQPDAVQLVSGQHVVVNAHRRERVRPLEHHAGHPSHLHRIHFEDISFVEQDFARHADVRIELVHTVDRPQQRAFTAARRAHDRRDRPFEDTRRDVFHGQFLRSVGDRQVVYLQFQIFHFAAIRLAMIFSTSVRISSSSEQPQIRSTRFGSL